MPYLTKEIKIDFANNNQTKIHNGTLFYFEIKYEQQAWNKNNTTSNESLHSKGKRTKKYQNYGVWSTLKVERGVERRLEEGKKKTE